MSDSVRLPDPVPDAKRLPRGSAIILRHYDAADRAALARALVRVCRRRGLRLLIAGDWRLAWRISADGVHLPEGLLAGWGPARRRPGWLVTAAAHSQRALLRAHRRGADAVLLSPVFPTESHPGRRVLGPVRFAAIAGQSPLPVYALGGIDATNARRLGPARIAGYAGIGGLLAGA